MKKALARGLSLTLVLAMALGFAPASAAPAGAAEAGRSHVPELDGPAVSAEPGGEIVWDFEGGTLEPFLLMEEGNFISGVNLGGKTYPCDLVSDIPYDHNSTTATPYPRQGKYHLTTLETTKNLTENPKPPAKYPVEELENITEPTDAYTGVIRSPIFRLDSAEIRFLVGGGNNPACYAALCDVYGRELVKSQNSPPGEPMIRVEWNVPEMVGQYVFVKIVDKATGGWGHITFDDFHAQGYVDPAMAQPLPAPAGDLKWGFEDGVITPFTAEGLSETAVVAWNTAGKDGNYYLSTRETDGAAGHVDESLTGSFRSPNFKIQASKVRAWLAGTQSADNYLAVCDAQTDEILAKASPAITGEAFQETILDLGAGYAENRAVYLLIADDNASGYVAVDGIHAKGEVIPDVEYVYQDYKWSFENKSIAPLTAAGGLVGHVEFGNSERDVNNPAAGELMNKDGEWYVHTAGPGHYTSEGATGTLASPLYVLDPTDPSIKIRLGGDATGACYAAICDESGRELVKGNNKRDTGFTGCHMLTDITLTVPDYKAGTPVYLKLVDNKTAGFGFLQFDDVRFRGMEYTPTGGYNPIRWSFERGDIFPFTTRSDFGLAVADLSVDVNDGKTPNEKHGTYFLCTAYKTDQGDSILSRFDETLTGSLRSPLFVLDPEAPTISMKLAGGANPLNYVAACDEAGNELAKVSPAVNGHIFHEAVLDLTGLADNGTPIYLKIVDATTNGWSFISVDDICARVLFKEEAPVTSANQVTEITGWDAKRFASVRSMVQNLMADFGADYGEGPALLAKIDQGEKTFEDFWKKGTYKPSDPTLLDFQEEMDELEFQAAVSNPLLDGTLAFVTRHQYAGDHHNTHNMFPDCEGEINQGAYQGGGAVKTLDLKTGQVSTLLSDEDGVYRDLEASYGGDKLLISYREQKTDASYHIWEYTLSGDKTEVTAESQLTCLEGADDMDPLYLPDGRIVFASTRDPKYVMCNRHIASNLYRMEADGANIVKITNSTLYERPTDLLPDGRILYDRWEYNDRDFGSAQGLWTVYSDGTQQVTYYGNNSPTGATIDAKAVPGTQWVMATLSSTHDRAWGGLALIDRSQGVDGKAPIVRTWPAEAANWIADPQDISDPGRLGGYDKHGNNIDAFSGLSIKYEDPQPLSDKYFLASRQIRAGSEKMGIYLLDIYGNEVLLYEDESDLGAYDATILQPREKEVSTQDRRDYTNNVGTFFVQNVYEGTHMQGVTPGSVKTLRIVESMPKRYISQSQQWNAEGQENPGVNWHSFETKRVIGEVPVYEDGSAYFEVPEDKFVYFQLLDEEGRMIQSMRSGTLVQSGEKTGCIGCHEDRRSVPDMDNDTQTPIALAESRQIVPNPEHETNLNAPETLLVNVPDKPQKRTLDFETGTDSVADYDDPVLYPTYESLPSMNYLTEVQPIFTKSCIECHGYENPAGGLTLVPDKDVIFNASYRDLWRDRGRQGAPFGGLTGAIGGGSSAFTTAKTWGSYASPLVNAIYNRSDHANLLTDAEKRRIAEWVDLNAPYYGDYASNYGYNPAGRSPLNQNDLNILGYNNWNGWSTTTPSMVYFDNPEKSPILRGLDTGSQTYRDKLAIIQKGLEQLRTAPDIDWRGLTAVPGDTSKAIYNQWEFCALDAWRTEKSEERWKIECAFRQAIANGQKLYDSDIMKPDSGYDPWPAGFPGWPSEGAPGHNPGKGA